MTETQFYEYLYQQEQRSKAMSEWQPISTAPKDGTRLILFDKIHKDVVFGMFVSFLSAPEFNDWKDLEGDQLYPTHWQPLPKPPTQ